MPHRMSSTQIIPQQMMLLAEQEQELREPDMVRVEPPVLSSINYPQHLRNENQGASTFSRRRVNDRSSWPRTREAANNNNKNDGSVSPPRLSLQSNSGHQKSILKHHDSFSDYGHASCESFFSGGVEKSVHFSDDVDVIPIRVRAFVRRRVEKFSDDRDSS